jgi:hypothetical protein
MYITRWLALVVCAGIFCSMPAAASHLVTGNGFGFAVVSPEKGSVTKLYAHPYSFVRPDPQNPLSEGVETTNFIKQLGWGTNSANAASAVYEQDSQVIHLQTAEGNGLVFMPFGLHRPALIVAWESASVNGRASGWHVEWSHSVTGRRLVPLSGANAQVLRFAGVPESLLLVPLSKEPVQSAQPNADLGRRRAWALIPLESDNEAEMAVEEFNRWRGGLAAKALAAREMTEIDRWRVKPAVHFISESERHLWRQSEVMLRIAQCREANRPDRYSNGLVVASLPDGVWFTPWVRDMAFASVALARMGHREEAREALLAYFNARPTGKMRAEVQGADYQVSVVRYFGDGSEEPFFTMEGSTNIEFDDWGEALWVLGEYLRLTGDRELLKVSTYRGRLYDSARDFVVKPLLKNTEPYGGGLIVAADTSIWEERQKDQKHFAYTTAEAIVGLREFAEVAHSEGDEPTRAEMLKDVAQLEKGFDAAFIRGGKLRGTLEEGVKNDIDGALLAIVNSDVITDRAVVRDTVDRMELLKVASGGYRRVRSTYKDPAIFEYWYERQEFVFVDFSLAEVLRRMGRDAEAAATLKRIVNKAAADHNILPEMYVAVPCPLFPGAIGDPTGALPMAGYGAGAYILDLLQREEWQRRK